MIDHDHSKKVFGIGAMGESPSVSLKTLLVSES